MKLSERFRPILRLAIPLGLALAVVRSEPMLTALVRNRPGVLPVAMASLLIGVLLPQFRRTLIAALCFGVALLAIEDALRPVQSFIPPALDNTYVVAAYPFVWAAVAVLGMGAGIAESLHPNSVLARRCYFATAAVYFTGHGALGLARAAGWDSLVMLVTGTVAAAGVFYAHRIVAAEEQDLPAAEDAHEAPERSARRAETLTQREWQDSAKG